MTECKCISFETRWTTAHWYMINYITNCIIGTRSNARILAFVSHASFVSRAIIVKYTFWSTTNSRIFIIVRQTRTDSIVALSVRSTGRWIT